MKPSILPRQALRPIHTPAICDSGAYSPETRASIGFGGSTSSHQAVHVCGPVAWQPSPHAASCPGSR